MSAFAQYPSLHGKSVFITGGATGIGASLVRAFAAQGCRVAFVDIAETEGQALAAEVQASHSQAIYFQRCDVTQVAQLREAIRTGAERCGAFSVLVNNVANDQRFDAQDMHEQDWKQSLAVNLDPAFFAAQAIYPMMVGQGGGSIINFSSINAIFGPARMPSYNTAKAGLLGMTKSLARDWGTEKIRVNAILPGWVITDKQLAHWLTPEIEAEWSKLVCLKDRLLPEDVANLTLFLAADDSRMITSQSFVIDAGRV